MNPTTQIRSIKDLPQPKGHWILGHYPEFKREQKHLVLERWSRECNTSLYKIRLGLKNFVVSTHPETNNFILKSRPDKFRRFSKINEVFSEMGINGVFDAEGEDWKRQRQPVADALNAKNIKSFYPVIIERTAQFLEAIKSRCHKNDSVLDIQKELVRFTIDVTTEVAFGYKTNTIARVGDDFQQDLELIFPKINERITAPFPAWRYLKTKSDKELEKALKRIEILIHSFIKNARHKIELNPDLQNDPTNFLEAILVDTNSGFSDKEIFGNVFTLLLAGEDTTSNTLAWTFFYLAQRPEIVFEIRKEAKRVYEGLTPNNYACFHQLEWANAVVYEAMRLKPTTPQLYMDALEDVVVEDCIVSKGTTVILQNKLAQNQEEYFTDANLFKPERWIKGKCPVHHNHDAKVMKAFGGGARFCPGMGLAMHEMVVLISSICRSFDMQISTKPIDVTEEFAFTMFPGNLYVKFDFPLPSLDEKIMVTSGS